MSLEREFYYRTTIDQDTKELIPGIITGQLQYVSRKDTYEVHIFIDPRRGGYTFTDDTGIVPIMRYDMEIEADTVQEDPISLILDMAWINVKTDLEYYEKKGTVTDA